jgi:hypothetical protein
MRSTIEEYFDYIGYANDLAEQIKLAKLELEDLPTEIKQARKKIISMETEMENDLAYARKFELMSLSGIKHLEY